MIKKKKLIIGPRNSGKTTLAYYFEGKDEPLRKRAHIIYGRETIDTPSTYLESPWMRQHLISLQQSAEIVFLLIPLIGRKKSYPPGFTQVFRVPVIGLITYTNEQSINDEIKEIRLKEIREIGNFKDIIFVNVTDRNQMKEQLKHY